jgi:hypothetical protein
VKPLEPVKWRILVASVEQRTAKLGELFRCLVPQLVPGEVEVLCYRDGWQEGIGAKRNLLMREAAAEYVSFVDDDDLVVDDFVPTLYPLLDGVDYVSFDLKPICPSHGKDFLVHQSLAYRARWDRQGRWLDIGHLCPMRREIARLAEFPDRYGEDEVWANHIRASGELRTEHHVDRVLYLYRVSGGELWGERRPVEVTPHPPWPCVSYWESEPLV